jgi:hypothetical protein
MEDDHIFSKWKTTSKNNSKNKQLKVKSIIFSKMEDDLNFLKERQPQFFGILGRKGVVISKVGLGFLKKIWTIASPTLCYKWANKRVCFQKLS